LQFLFPKAGVCRAWHIFVDNGVNPDNIITMMYDDVAYHEENLYPGKLFNIPNGADVYEGEQFFFEFTKNPKKGVRIDYKGEDVNPANFMAVLLGDETVTNGKPVLKSSKNDKVFVYYTDHGGSGVVAFPSGKDSVVRLTNK
jgi:legumain